MITVIQTCDRCGTKRGIAVTGAYGPEVSLKHLVTNGGWVVIDGRKDGKHLCSDCVERALSR